MVVIAVSALYLGMRANFDPTIGPARLLYAFEAVIIGGLGSFWGTLAGGIIIGVAQTVGGQDQSRMADPGRAPGLPRRARAASARPLPPRGGLRAAMDLRGCSAILGARAARAGLRCVARSRCEPAVRIAGSRGGQSPRADRARSTAAVASDGCLRRSAVRPQRHARQFDAPWRSGRHGRRQRRRSLPRPPIACQLARDGAAWLRGRGIVIAAWRGAAARRPHSDVATARATGCIERLRRRATAVVAPHTRPGCAQARCPAGALDAGAARGGGPPTGRYRIGWRRRARAAWRSAVRCFLRAAGRSAGLRQPRPRSTT